MTQEKRIDEKRLGDLFTKLAQIDSESRDEARIAKELETILTGMGARVVFDDAAHKVGETAAIFWPSSKAPLMPIPFSCRATWIPWCRAGG